MKLYDISREVLSAAVYQGDPAPALQPVARIAEGAPANVSQLTLCTHCATHMDAPLHYLEGGASAGELSLVPFFGPCTLISVCAPVTGRQAEQMVGCCEKRILLHGNGRAFVTQSAAFVFAEAGVLLVGTDGLSIAYGEQEDAVHKQLLLAGIPILEGLQFGSLPDGDYLLSAPPLKIAGADGAPVRAVLMKN